MFQLFVLHICIGFSAALRFSASTSQLGQLVLLRLIFPAFFCLLRAQDLTDIEEVISTSFYTHANTYFRTLRWQQTFSMVLYHKYREWDNLDNLYRSSQAVPNHFLLPQFQFLEMSDRPMNDEDTRVDSCDGKKKLKFMFKKQRYFFAYLNLCPC